MSAAAYPLTWPETMPRRSSARDKGIFRTSLPRALDNVTTSLNAFAKDSGKAIGEIVLSSNVTLGQTRPADPGVAVWFAWDGLRLCIPVDRYTTVEANLQAIHLIIEARRVELRHGTLSLVRASFQGFTALPPPPGKKTWREVLMFGPDMLRPNRDMVEKRYRELAKKDHPDVGGSDDTMAELNAAKAAALKEIGE